MARPSVWRWEFQQVESEYMIKKPGAEGKPDRTRPKEVNRTYMSA